MCQRQRPKSPSEFLNSSLTSSSRAMVDLFMLPRVQQVRWSLWTRADSSHMVRKANDESLEAVPNVQAASRSAPLSAGGIVVLCVCMCEGRDFTE